MTATWASIADDIGAGLDTLPADQQEELLVLLDRIAAPYRERPVDGDRLLQELRPAAANIAPLLDELSKQMEVATHEAGHAVAARMLGVTVHRLSAQADARASGWVELTPQAPLRAETPAERDAIERWVVIELAGSIAGANRATVDGRTPSAADWQRHEQYSRDLIARIVDIDETEVELYWSWLRARARALVFGQWGSIRLVADALYHQRTLTGEAVEELLNPAQKAAA